MRVRLTVANLNNVRLCSIGAVQTAGQNFSSFERNHAARPNRRRLSSVRNVADVVCRLTANAEHFECDDEIYDRGFSHGRSWRT